MPDEIKFSDKIQQLRLIDDVLMNEVFRDMECTELLLRVILKRNDIKVFNARTQRSLKSFGRSLKLDIWAEDEDNPYINYNVEIQRSNQGANVRRSRLHSGAIDFFALAAGDDFSELGDSYVIFITEHDVLKNGLPMYTVDRYINETGEKFSDGSHIIYVNGECRDGNTELGRLMQDFFEPDPDKMNYPVLAKRVRYLKEGEGTRKMSYTIQELFKDELAAGRAEALQAGMTAGMTAGIETGRKEGIEAGRKVGIETGRKEGIEVGRKEGIAEGREETLGGIITNLLTMGRLAFSEIAQAAGVSLSRVQTMADSLGIHEPA